MEREHLYPMSVPISVAQVGNLREAAHIMDLALAEIEFIAIINIYNAAITRLLKENGETE